MHKKAEAPRKKKKLQNRLKTEKLPPKIPKLPEHTKNCRSSFKNSENRLKTQKNPKLTQKRKKLTIARFFKKFPHKKANSRTVSRTTGQIPAQNPQIPAQEGRKIAQKRLLGKICVFERVSSVKTDFSVNLLFLVPKRPETSFSDQIAFFALFLHKQLIFSQFKYFCLAWF